MFKNPQAFARHNRIGVNGADHHPRDSMRENQIGAGRLRTDMAAWLKRVDNRGTAHIDAICVGVIERHAFRVGATVAIVISGGENLAVTHHHCADHRIRVHPSRASAGQIQCHRHVSVIFRSIIHTFRILHGHMPEHCVPPMALRSTSEHHVPFQDTAFQDAVLTIPWHTIPFAHGRNSCRIVKIRRNPHNTNRARKECPPFMLQHSPSRRSIRE